MLDLHALDLRSALLGLLPLALIYFYSRWLHVPYEERAVKFAWSRPEEIACVHPCPGTRLQR